MPPPPLLAGANLNLILCVAAAEAANLAKLRLCMSKLANWQTGKLISISISIDPDSLATNHLAPPNLRAPKGATEAKEKNADNLE